MDAKGDGRSEPREEALEFSDVVGDFVYREAQFDRVAELVAFWLRQHNARSAITTGEGAIEVHGPML